MPVTSSETIAASAPAKTTKVSNKTRITRIPAWVTFSTIRQHVDKLLGGGLKIFRDSSPFGIAGPSQIIALPDMQYS